MKYKGGYKYQLYEEVECPALMGFRDPERQDIKSEYIDLDPFARMIIRRGYCWDGPSGPTIDTKNFMRGSLIHDALYQLIREGRLSEDSRLEADQLLRDMFIHDSDKIIDASDSWGWVKASKRKAARVRATYIYLSVRMFGGSAAGGKPKEIKEAP